MWRLVPLEASEARDVGLVGAKAAQLARARSEGLPVLAGWVLPLEVSSDPLRLGREAGDERGPAAATLVVSSRSLEAALTRDLGSIRHPAVRSSIVRSSTPFDDDGRWAGAFATYHDVAPALLPVAVRGCWASALSSDVTARAEALGMPVTGIGVGVLIQPWLTFAFGGTARWHPDGGVELTFVDGGPAGIVDGSGGRRVEVVPSRDGDGSEVVAAAVALARATAAATGADRIEWGWADGRASLLQAGTSTPAAPTAQPAPRFSADARLLSLARMVSRCRAPLGDELVVPWALAIDEPPITVPVRVDDPSRVLAEATELAARLAADAWDLPSDAALRAASDVTRSLLGPEPERGIAMMPPARAIDRVAVGRILGSIAAIGEVLAGGGVLDHPERVWRLTVGELRQVLGGAGAVAIRDGPDRWEPFVCQALFSARSPMTGIAATPGVGAGRVHIVGRSSSIRGPRPRAVVAAPVPLPQLAPLLFRASALVVARGGTGAHLFEVARSLGIPAVTGVEVSTAEEGAVVAVDGDRAEVAILEDTPIPASIAIGGS